MPRSTANKRFTLIELLVVVAIIAILAALLVPALMLAKRKALASARMSKQMQLALAFAQYPDDSSGAVFCTCTNALCYDGHAEGMGPTQLYRTRSLISSIVINDGTSVQMH